MTETKIEWPIEQREKYERKTGRCYDCSGVGMVGYNHFSGVKGTKCPRCKGTGKPRGKCAESEAQNDNG